MTIETELPYRPCVGVMLINRDGLVFVGKRSDVPLARKAPVIGGRCRKADDEGEDPEEAAAASCTRRPG